MTDIKTILKHAKRDAYTCLPTGSHDIWLDDVVQEVAIARWLFEQKGGTKFRGDMHAHATVRKLLGSTRTHDKVEFVRKMRRGYVPTMSDRVDPVSPMTCLASVRIGRKWDSMGSEQREALLQAAGVEKGSEIARRRGVTSQAVSQNKRDVLAEINRR